MSQVVVTKNTDLFRLSNNITPLSPLALDPLKTNKRLLKPLNKIKPKSL